VEVTIALDHRWPQSAWLEGAPVLGDGVGGWDARVVPAVAAIALIVLALVAFLLAARRAGSPWPGVQALLFLPFALFQVGLLPRALGAWDVAVVVATLPAALFAGIRRRAWIPLPLAGIAAAPFLGSPFHATTIAAPLLLAALVATCVAAIRARRHAIMTALLFGAVAQDLFAWLGARTPALGAIAMALFVLLCVLPAPTSASASAPDSSDADADAQRRRLFADLAHELATPASSILGITDALTTLVKAPDAAPMLKLLESEGERLERLVTDIRLLATLEDPDRPLETTATDVAALAAQVCDRVALEDGSPRRIRYLGATEPIMATVDALRIDQVLSNLLSNARRYTPRAGEITVAVAAAPGKVTLQVEDSGIGVATEIRPQLGDRLLRIDPSRSRETGNHGLGLSIVAVIVKRHGGEIRFDRARLGGLGITIELPA
jgi:signal transduction histidine kinase